MTSIRHRAPLNRAGTPSLRNIVLQHAIVQSSSITFWLYPFLSKVWLRRRHLQKVSFSFVPWPPQRSVFFCHKETSPLLHHRTGKKRNFLAKLLYSQLRQNTSEGSKKRETRWYASFVRQILLAGLQTFDFDCCATVISRRAVLLRRSSCPRLVRTV